MKNLLIPTLLVLTVIVFVGFFVFKDKPQPQGDLGQQFTLGAYYLNERISTTSPRGNRAFITVTATTTLYIPSGSANLIDLNIWVDSTTTVPTVIWNLQFGQGTCPVARSQAALANCNLSWIAEDGKTVTSDSLVTHGTGIVNHRWLTASTSDNKNIEISPVASAFTRVNFGVTGAAVDIWAKAVVREPTN